MRYRYYINDTLLDNPVRNWDKFLSVAVRDDRWKGIIVEIPKVTLEFIGDGSDVIKNTHDTKGSTWNKDVFKVEESVDGFLTFTTYLFKLDYYTYSLGNEPERVVKIGLRQTDLIEKLNARSKTEVSTQSLINIDQESITPFVDELTIVDLDAQIVDAANLHESIGENAPAALLARGAIPSVTFQLPFNSNTGSTLGGSFTYPARFYSTNRDEIVNGAEVGDREFPFEFHRVQDNEYREVSINLNGDLEYSFVTLTESIGFTNTINVYLDTRIELFTENEEEERRGVLTPDRVLLKTITNGTNGGEVIYTDTIVINHFQTIVNPLGNFTKNDRFYIYITIEGIVGNLFSNTVTSLNFSEAGASLELTAVTTHPDTQIKGLLIHEFATRLLQHVTGVQDPLRSGLLGRTDSLPVAYDQDGDLSNILVSNIFQAREFPINDYPIYASFDDFFDAVNAITPIALSLSTEGGSPILRLEALADTFNNVEGVAISGQFAPSSVLTSINESLVYGGVKFGDKNFEDEQFGILTTPNATRTFTTIAESKNDYSFECPFITSGTTIELSGRRKPFSDTEKEDTRHDNTPIFISLIRDGIGWVRAKDEGFTNIQNLENSDSTYNLRLMPQIRLRNHLPFIAAGLWGMVKSPNDYDNPDIIFSSGEANYRVTYSFGGVDYNEKGSIPISGITPIFTNVVYEFTIPRNKTDRSELIDNFDKLVTVINRHGTYEGYLESADPENVKTGMTKITLRQKYIA